MKVSVIVPIYNIDAYLEDCLISLKKQTLKEVEFLLIDDGSKDHSYDIMKKYQKEDPRFHLFQKENGGLSSARNFGMKHAKGEYLAFIDGDDTIDPEMLETMYQKAKEEDADVVECDFIWEYPNKKKVDVRKSNPTLTNIRVLACNKLYRKAFLDSLDLTFLEGYRYEDILFTYSYFPYVNKISYVCKPFYHYLQRKNSIANSMDEKVRDIFPILEAVLSYYQAHDLDSLYQEELEYLWIRYFFGSHFLRVVQIKDRTLRNQILNETYHKLKTQFPSWRKNRYLKEKGLKNWYYRSLNPVTYRLSSIFFHMVRR